MPARVSASYRVFVRNLLLDCEIGVYDHERGRRQRVRVNIDMEVQRRDADAPADSMAGVVSYEDVVTGVRRLTQNGHINLVETFALKIADFCLENPQVLAVTVSVEKLDVYVDAESVGVEVTRRRGE